MQNIANVKNNIQRNRTVCRFDPAHMGTADVEQLCKLILGKTSFLAVICNVQTQMSVLLCLLLLHILTPYKYTL